MCADSKLGFEGMLNIEDEKELFSETQSRAVIEVDEANLAKVQELLQEFDIRYEEAGVVSQRDLMLNSISLSSTELEELYFNSFAKMMNQDL
jgi:phosphoribosylformylglycinamidine synthase